jgi:hypothetical protein
MARAFALCGIRGNERGEFTVHCIAPACQNGSLLIRFGRLRMIPKSGYRFSEKIMRKAKAATRAAVAQLVQSA